MLTLPNTASSISIITARVGGGLLLLVCVCMCVVVANFDVAHNFFLFFFALPRQTDARQTFFLPSSEYVREWPNAGQTSELMACGHRCRLLNDSKPAFGKGGYERRKDNASRHVVCVYRIFGRRFDHHQLAWDLPPEFYCYEFYEPIGLGLFFSEWRS